MDQLTVSARGRRGSSVPGGHARLCAAVIGAAVLLRLVFSSQVELMPEETYYWNYSQHLDIGYLDHPPMVAWLIRLGTALFGNCAFGVRFGALCCGAATGYFTYRVACAVFGASRALVALTFSQVLPFFFMSGMLMTPDAPLTAAWAATLYFLERALIGGRPRAWFGVGLAMGAGLLSKYTIGLLGVSALLFMLLDAPSRRWFRRWEPYAAVALAALVFTPVVIWNAEHEWASFAFQTARRLAERPRFSLHKLIGAAVVLLTPTGLVAVAVALGRGGLKSAHPEDRARRFLRIAILVPLFVFASFSLRHEVKLDWMGAPWVAALPLLAAGFGETRRSGRGGWQGVAWRGTWVILLALYAGVFFHLAWGIPGLGYSRHTELLPVGWRELGRQVDALAEATRGEFGGELLVVGMDRYAIASERAFYSDNQSRAVAETTSWHVFGDMGLMYERWFPVRQQVGRTLLLVGFDPESLDDAHLRAHVSGLDPVRELIVQRQGRAVRRFYYRVAHGYR